MNLEPRTLNLLCMNWYYAIEGHAHGPVTEHGLGELAHEGKLGTDTLIWHPGLEEWEPLWKLKPTVLEKPDKNVMAVQAKGSTDRIPLPAKPEGKPEGKPEAKPERSGGSFLKRWFGRGPKDG